MSLTPENIPEQTETHEDFQPQDWLGPTNTRTVIHVGRDALLGSVRSLLDGLKPQLAISGGVCFYRAFSTDANEYRVLLTNHPDIAGPASTVISINKTRQPMPDEPVFPDGQVLELTDLSVRNLSRWMNTSWETLYRGHHEHAWDNPRFATILQPRHDTVKIIGNLCNDAFDPAPARDMQEVADYAEALWTAWDALSLCNSVALEEGITSITTV